ncbi:MAG: YfgM family protein [Bradymonadia bacterium]
MVKKIKKRIPKQPADVDAGLSPDVADGGVSPSDGGDLATLAAPATAAAASTASAAVSASTSIVPDSTSTDDDGFGDEDEVPSGKLDFGDIAEDDFGRATARGLQWLVERKGLVIGVALAALGASIGVWYSNSSSAAEKATTAKSFFSGTESFTEANAPADKDKPVDTAALVESARADFDRLKKAGQGTPLAQLADLGLAGAAFKQGKTKDAVDGYASVASGSKDPMLKAVAIHGRAVAWEDAKNYGEAVKAWQTLAEVDKPAFGLLSGIQVGRLLEAEGKSAEAKTHYETMQKDFAEDLEKPANRSVKADIERRIARLKGGA